MGAPEDQPGARPDRRDVRWIVIGTLLPIFIANLSQGIVAPALPMIDGEFGTRGQAPAIVSAYLVAGSVATPIFGKLCDGWGRRKTLDLAIWAYILGSIASALAPTMPLLVASRALQGLGGGPLTALTLVIVADVVAPRERGLYQPYLTTTFLLGALCGPIIGGVLAELWSWRLIFWVSALLGLGALALGRATLRRHHYVCRPQPFDYAGAALMVLASTTLLVAIDPRGDNASIGLIACAAIFGGAFVWQLGKSPKPLISLEVVRSPIVFNATLATSLATGVTLLLTTFLPTYLQTAKGISVADSGLALAPVVAGAAVGSIIGGQTMARAARYRWVGEAGLLAAAAASTAMACLAPYSPSIWAIELCLCIVTIGIGTVMPITMVSLQNAVASEHLGMATSATNYLRQLIGAVLVAATAGLLGMMAGWGGPPSGALFLAMTVSLICGLFFLRRMEERPLRSGVE